MRGGAPVRRLVRGGTPVQEVRSPFSLVLESFAGR